MSQQQNQPPQNRPSPFGTPSGTRPFGGSAPAASSSAPGSRPGSAPAPAPNPPQPANRLGGLPRFGPNKTEWRIFPVGGAVVRFDLNGLGDPFHRLLGAPLSVDYGSVQSVVMAIEAGGAAVNEMENALNLSWQEYDLRGAVLLYPWRKDLPQVMVGRQSASEGDEDDDYDDEKPAPPVILRALDLRMVINVLARTRSNILLSRAPLGLEGQYLAQSLYTDDPRVIALARATGCIEESLLR